MRSLSEQDTAPVRRDPDYVEISFSLVAAPNCKWLRYLNTRESTALKSDPRHV